MQLSKHSYSKTILCETEDSSPNIVLFREYCILLVSQYVRNTAQVYIRGENVGPFIPSAYDILG